MRAWQYSGTTSGLEKNLYLNFSAPLPKPKPDQHLVQIIATALNPVDYRSAECHGLARLAITEPVTPGMDFAGFIVRPATHSPLRPGQLVFGLCDTKTTANGALREFSTPGVRTTVAIPDGVDPVDAATVGMAGLTAYQSIVPHVKSGDKVFINGGSGGTGVFAIQFAKAVGCHVTTTCSTANVELCKSLGADEVVDYKKEKVPDVLLRKAKEQHRFDHAVDNIGIDEQLVFHCHEFLQSGATMAVVGGEPSLKAAAQILRRNGYTSSPVKGNVVALSPKQNPGDLQQIGEWMKVGKVKTVIDTRFSFEQAPQAFKKLKIRRVRGKIVIDVASEPHMKKTT
ncbi:MAG: hypothetical protein Q9225_002802 [Loekoesia sp. 1 TL-2023]